MVTINFKLADIKQESSEAFAAKVKVWLANWLNLLLTNWLTD